MQEKLITGAYTLRTYWNQFSLGGICNPEAEAQRSQRRITRQIEHVLHRLRETSM